MTYDHNAEHTALNVYIGATATMLTMQIDHLTDTIRVARCVEILREFHAKFPSDCTARCLAEYDEAHKPVAADVTDIMRQEA